MIDFIKDFLNETDKFIKGTEEYLKTVFLPYCACLFVFLLYGCVVFAIGYAILDKFDLLPSPKPYYIQVYAKPDDADYYYHVKAKVLKGRFEKLYLKNKEVDIDDRDYESINNKGEIMRCGDENGVWWDLRYYGEKPND